MALVQKVKLDQISKAERKLEGLNKRKPDKVTFILKVERLWEEYALDRTEKNLNRLIKSLTFTIKRRAELMEQKWKNKRLSKSDFESVFYEELWKLCENYNHYGEFYFYETFLLAIKNRGIDVTRKLQTKKGIFEKNILPLNEEAEQFIPDPNVNIEKDVVNSDLVERLLNEQSLTEKERKILLAIYDNPDVSYRELAIEFGYNHHEQVCRTIDKIKKKLFKNFL